MKKKIKSIKYKKQSGGMGALYKQYEKMPSVLAPLTTTGTQMAAPFIESGKQILAPAGKMAHLAARSIASGLTNDRAILNAMNAQAESNETLIKRHKLETYRLIVESRFKLLFTFIGFVIQVATSAMGAMFIFLIIVLEICIAVFNILEAGVRKNIVNPIRTIIPIRVKSGRIIERSWMILWKLVKYLFSLIS